MSISEFTFSAYREMLSLINNCGYAIVSYGESDVRGKRCILRHDIDMSPEKALRLAEIERDCGVKSTYFVLLKTDFYNPFSAHTSKILKQIMSMGHTIGLHFDETAYPEDTDIPSAIRKEADILAQATGEGIGVVSMHRPSKSTLAANYTIDGIINSYSEEYFKKWKCISDSNGIWHEDVEAAIESGRYPALHILAHAFLYDEKHIDIANNLRCFIRKAIDDRYRSVDENYRNLEAVLKREDI